MCIFRDPTTRLIDELLHTSRVRSACIERLINTRLDRITSAIEGYAKRNAETIYPLLADVINTNYHPFNKTIIQASLNALAIGFDYYDSDSKPSMLANAIASYLIRTCPDPLAVLLPLIPSPTPPQVGQLVILVYDFSPDVKHAGTLTQLVASDNEAVAIDALLEGIDQLPDGPEYVTHLAAAAGSRFELVRGLAAYRSTSEPAEAKARIAQGVLEQAIHGPTASTRRRAAKCLPYFSSGLARPPEILDKLLNFGDPFVSSHTVHLITRFIYGNQLSFEDLRPLVNSSSLAVRRPALMAAHLVCSTVSELEACGFPADDVDLVCRRVIQETRMTLAKTRRSHQRI